MPKTSQSSKLNDNHDEDDELSDTEEDDNSSVVSTNTSRLNGSLTKKVQK
jgi:hypothetical protein